MSTINHWDIVEDLIARNGEHYSGEDPPVLKIYEYKNMVGTKAWKLVYYPRQETELFQSPYVRNPICIFERGSKQTIIFSKID